MNRLLLLFTLLLASILPAAAQRTVSICMVGDIMPGTTYPDSTTLAFLSRTPEKLFEKTSHIFKGADLTIGNLESTLVDIGDASPRKKAVGNNYIFRTPTQYAGIMKKAGIDVLTVANNHLFDFGAKGLKSTVGALDKAGIHYAGIRKAHMVTTVVRNNLTISICAFGHSSMSPSIFDFNAAEKLIDSLKRKSDIVVVSFHGGAEGVQHEHIPFREEMFHGERRGDVHAFAHRCVDAGADIVFGHGPHIVRGMELYKGRLIAYSLGNFCTPYRVSLEGTSKFAPVLKVEVGSDGAFRIGHIYSFIQEYGKGPQPDPQNMSAKRISYLSKFDFPLSKLHIADDGWITLGNTQPVRILLEEAKAQLGCKYRHGHSGNGYFDCSGFTKYVYARIGYYLNPSSKVQFTQGRPVKKNELRAGDLVFFGGSKAINTVGHVGIVVDVSRDGKSFRFIHASNRGVVIDRFPDMEYYVKRYIGARRILP